MIYKEIVLIIATSIFNIRFSVYQEQHFSKNGPRFKFKYVFYIFYQKYLKNHDWHQTNCAKHFRLCVHFDHVTAVLMLASHGYIINCNRGIHGNQFNTLTSLINITVLVKPLPKRNRFAQVARNKMLIYA